MKFFLLILDFSTKHWEAIIPMVISVISLTVAYLAFVNGKKSSEDNIILIKEILKTNNSSNRE